MPVWIDRTSVLASALIGAVAGALGGGIGAALSRKLGLRSKALTICILVAFVVASVPVRRALLPTLRPYLDSVLTLATGEARGPGLLTQKAPQTAGKPIWTAPGVVIEPKSAGTPLPWTRSLPRVEQRLFSALVKVNPTLEQQLRMEAARIARQEGGDALRWQLELLSLVRAEARKRIPVTSDRATMMLANVIFNWFSVLEKTHASACRLLEVTPQPLDQKNLRIVLSESFFDALSQVFEDAAAAPQPAPAPRWVEERTTYLVNLAMDPKTADFVDQNAVGKPKTLCGMVMAMLGLAYSRLSEPDVGRWQRGVLPFFFMDFHI